MSKIAVVQHSPVVLDKKTTIELAVSLMEEAAANGAKLIVFSETFIPGYPAWVWRLRPGGDWGTYEALHRRLLANAVDVSSNDLAPLYAAAKKLGMTVVCGIEEKDDSLSRSTLYNTVITIGDNGTLLNKHRKLMPTNPERMVWGMGDASGLKAVETPLGRVGALICWENYMPLARYAMYAQGVEVYIAPTYDSGEAWLESAKHIAREGRCYVVGCGNLIQGKDIPTDFPDKASLYPDADEWVNPGDSIIIAPGGEVLEGPLHRESGILYADIDREHVAASKRALDVVGHYSRPDIFTLQVNTKAQSPVSFES